eukprot:SAG22_NODE_5934_length_928_cov_1.294331_2_plen_69_part_00
MPVPVPASTAVRFEAVPLPQNAAILSAAVMFTVDEVRTESGFPVTLTISAQDSADAEPLEHDLISVRC